MPKKLRFYNPKHPTSSDDSTKDTETKRRMGRSPKKKGRKKSAESDTPSVQSNLQSVNSESYLVSDQSEASTSTANQSLGSQELLHSVKNPPDFSDGNELFQSVETSQSAPSIVTSEHVESCEEVSSRTKFDLTESEPKCPDPLPESTSCENVEICETELEDDTRFEFISSFLDYLDEWRTEVAQLNIPDAEKQKRTLSQQTLTGIERITRAFQGVMKYLLGKRKTLPDHSKEGYILGRTFQQDRAEHYFSRQRAMGGGSSHPSATQFLQHQNAMEVQGNLNMKRPKGNTEVVEDSIDVDAPAPKRRKVNRKLQLRDSED